MSRPQKVVLIDVAMMSVIVKRTGIDGLEALARTGDKVFFSRDAADELLNTSVGSNNRGAINRWLAEKRKAGILLEEVEPVSKTKMISGQTEAEFYNTTGKQSAEVWDMSARKFMHESKLNGKDYVFKIYSDDNRLMDNLDRLGIDPKDTIEFHSAKKTFINLTFNPNVDLTEEQFNTIRDTEYNRHTGIWQGKLEFPKTYEKSLELKEKVEILYRLGDWDSIEVLRKYAGNVPDGRGSSALTALNLEASGILISIIVLKSGISFEDIVEIAGINLEGIAMALGQEVAKDLAVSGVAAGLTSWSGPGAGLAATLAYIIRQGYKASQNYEDIESLIETAKAIINQVASEEFQAAFSEILQMALQGSGVAGAERQITFDEFVKEIYPNGADERQIQELMKIYYRDGCFLRGTKISMWEGGKKSIEEIASGDYVTAYNSEGSRVQGRVTRIFQHRARHILDVFGLYVTPGHVTLCGDGRFSGRHVPMIDVLRSDGALVREDGSMIRACTNELVGSFRDRLVWAVTGEKLPDGSIQVRSNGRIRLGTRYITETGQDVCVADLIYDAGADVSPEGLVTRGSSGEGSPFYWPFSHILPNPEDYVLQRSALSLNEIYKVGEWEAVKPQMPIPDESASSDSALSRAVSPNLPLSLRGDPLLH